MKIVPLLLVFCAMTVTDLVPEAFAAPVVSPLAPTKDALGESLQKSLIWAPSRRQTVVLRRLTTRFERRGWPRIHVTSEGHSIWDSEMELFLM